MFHFSEIEITRKSREMPLLTEEEAVKKMTEWKHAIAITPLPILTQLSNITDGIIEVVELKIWNRDKDRSELVESFKYTKKYKNKQI